MKIQSPLMIRGFIIHGVIGVFELALRIIFLTSRLRLLNRWGAHRSRYTLPPLLKAIEKRELLLRWCGAFCRGERHFVDLFLFTYIHQSLMHQTLSGMKYLPLLFDFAGFEEAFGLILARRAPKLEGLVAVWGPNLLLNPLSNKRLRSPVVDWGLQCHNAFHHVLIYLGLPTINSYNRGKGRVHQLVSEVAGVFP